MTKFRLSRRRAFALSLAPMIASGIARAQSDWPNKSVRYINHFPPGGATDVLSRVVCQELSELTGQQFMDTKMTSRTFMFPSSPNESGSGR